MRVACGGEGEGPAGDALPRLSRNHRRWCAPPPLPGGGGSLPSPPPSGWEFGGGAWFHRSGAWRALSPPSPRVRALVATSQALPSPSPVHSAVAQARGGCACAGRLAPGPGQGAPPLSLGTGGWYSPGGAGRGEWPRHPRRPVPPVPPTSPPLVRPPRPDQAPAAGLLRPPCLVRRSRKGTVRWPGVGWTAGVRGCDGRNGWGVTTPTIVSPVLCSTPPLPPIPHTLWSQQRCMPTADASRRVSSQRGRGGGCAAAAVRCVLLSAPRRRETGVTRTRAGGEGSALPAVPATSGVVHLIAGTNWGKTGGIRRVL